MFFFAIAAGVFFAFVAFRFCFSLSLSVSVWGWFITLGLNTNYVHDFICTMGEVIKSMQETANAIIEED